MSSESKAGSMVFGNRLSVIGKTATAFSYELCALSSERKAGSIVAPNDFDTLRYSVIDCYLS